MTPLRRTLAPLLLLLPAPRAQEPVPAVLPGLDVLVETGFAELAGRRVGLITNHTGRTFDGRSAVDVFLEQDACELVALFGPEHGFEGRLDRDGIADGRHASGLPIWSLYGETRKPTARMLEGLDTLVFDIQDIGARFYTYVSTMRLAMEAAAEHGLHFWVLDRPNPIGGVHVQGPVADPDQESFVATHTLPVRHGMTAGELARMFAAERGIDCELHVVAMRGWQRSMYFEHTGLSWVDPSPNMRNVDQALLYPGVALIEFTNVSVGRGTDTPFEWVGAPWLDARRVAARLDARAPEGLRFVPTAFVPRESRFAGETCGAVRFVITDRYAVDPLRLGIELACALRDVHEDAWEPERLGRLLASKATLDAFLAGAGADALEALWRDDLAAFAERRERHLLY